jgi:uncharacterized protein (TIGR02466 family)
MTYEIYNLFPTPLFSYKNFLPPEYFEQVEQIVKNQEYVYNSHGDDKVKTSSTKNIFKLIPFLKEEIEETFKEYAYNIFKVKQTVGFKVGSSWATMTEPGKDSRPHTHANYYYTGCYYISDDPSPINFKLGGRLYNFHEVFLFEYEEPNCFNNNTISYIPQKNELLFFPSYLKHRISTNKSNENRYSIAFNIHPVGKYGVDDSSIHIDVIDDIE